MWHPLGQSIATDYGLRINSYEFKYAFKQCEVVINGRIRLLKCFSFYSICIRVSTMDLVNIRRAGTKKLKKSLKIHLSRHNCCTCVINNCFILRISYILAISESKYSN